MKQIQIEYKNITSLKKELSKIQQWVKANLVSNVVFQLFSETADGDEIKAVCDVIEESLPDALYYGCSTNGNIVHGKKSESALTIICTIYEYASTRVALLQCSLEEDALDDSVNTILRFVEDNTWVKSVEMLATIQYSYITEFLNKLEALPWDVCVFGGASFNPDLDMASDRSMVFSKGQEISNCGVIFFLTGGEDYYVTASYITGWKSLGKEFTVTKSDGVALMELDGEPAYTAYNRYLNIDVDDNFFQNTIEFPFLYQADGTEILRSPVACLPDGTLIMTSPVKENVKVKISYGDPWTILASVNFYVNSLRSHQPEIIKIFSCAGRRSYWGDEEISRETKDFEQIAPASGFYTAGEFLRTGNRMHLHNVTLAIADMREGNYEETDMAYLEDQDIHFSNKISMVNRLATFINVATRELSEANEKLVYMAITDGMTKLLNRKEMQNRIYQQMETGSLCLIMMDIDNFKRVNDTYGHKEGDNVIIGLSDLLRKQESSLPEGIEVGRWGGEEFMMMVKDCNPDRAMEIAENIRISFEKIEFPSCSSQTISIGVTEKLSDDTTDMICNRVDKALYHAKKQGKNRTVLQ